MVRGSTSLLRTPLLLALLFTFPVSFPVHAQDPAGESFHSACLSCHWAEDSTDRIPTPSSRGPGCLDCHAEVLRVPESEAAGGSAPNPGPASGHWELDCDACHAPHDRGEARLLKTSLTRDEAGFDPVSNLCTACHRAFGEFGFDGSRYRRHPVGIPPTPRDGSGLGAPGLPLTDVAGTADRGDDLIACTTCHVVHVSPNAYLLRWSKDREPYACVSCHSDKLRGPTAALTSELSTP